MAREADYRSLPFDEAIRFFRGKVNIPTERWNDLWQGMHARGFMVAGAAKDELLTDFRTSLDKAISDGTTIEQFRKDFDRIVSTHGWSYRGGRGWRSEVIYSTNLSTAYSAGRYAQMTDPDVAAYRPYWRYRHGDSRHPRPLHLEWNGTVLRSDDAWWKTHYAPNGWGCSCFVEPLSERDLKRLGKSGPDTAPDNGTYTWTDRATGEQHRIPAGIDPGWDYNVGEAAWGRQISQQAMDSSRAAGAQAWERLTPGGWHSEGRPERVTLDSPRAQLGRRAAGSDEMADALRVQMGGAEKIFTPPGGAAPVLVNAEVLAGHVDLVRSPYLPLLEEVLTDPFEVWLSFERHRETGQVVLRERLIKGIDTGEKSQFIAVANATKGRLEAWTFVPTDDLKYLNRQRTGKLLYGRG